MLAARWHLPHFQLLRLLAERRSVSVHGANTINEIVEMQADQNCLKIMFKCSFMNDYFALPIAFGPVFLFCNQSKK